MRKPSRVIDAVRALVFREFVYIAACAVVGILFMMLAREWMTVTNPDYDPYAGEILNCSAGVDSVGNDDYGCWDTNTPTMRDETRENISLYVLFGGIGLAMFGFARLGGQFEIEETRRRARSAFLSGEIEASEMELWIEGCRYQQHLSRLLEKGELRHSQYEAAVREYEDAGPGQWTWRYSRAELRRQFDKGKLTLEEFEKKQAENDAWLNSRG